MASERISDGFGQASAAGGAVGAGAPEVLLIDRERFAADFNKRHFEVAHRLAEHPLFQLPRLLELAREMQAKWPKDIYFDLGVSDIGSRWSPTAPDVSVADVMQRLETSKAWIDFKSAEKSLEYGKILNSCIRDLLRVSGRELERTMVRKQMAVFVTSPNRISTYHMDSEVNFLLQLRGEKTISIFPKDDPEVVTEPEKERFWTVDTNAAVYKPELQGRADPFRLKPGNGVHIPVNAPHWVQNGDKVSISVAILYHSRPSAYANLYAANHLLRRKFKLDPTPPFQSPVLDALKQPLGAATQLLQSYMHGPIRDKMKNAEGIPDRTVWND